MTAGCREEGGGCSRVWCEGKWPLILLAVGGADGAEEEEVDDWMEAALE